MKKMNLSRLASKQIELTAPAMKKVTGGAVCGTCCPVGDADKQLADGLAKVERAMFRAA